MKHKAILKIVVDTGMTVMLLFLMTYELIGEAAHEWLGIGMFVLFVIHHILNRKWIRSVFKGKYTLFRIWQTVLVIGILLTMAGSMYSGVILSKHAISFLSIKAGGAFAREIHMVSVSGRRFLLLESFLQWLAPCIAEQFFLNMQYHFCQSKQEALLPERFTWFPPIADLY